jgi:hypothetical protein
MATMWLDPTGDMMRPRQGSPLAGSQDELSELVPESESDGQPDAGTEAAVGLAVTVVGVPGADVERHVERSDDEDGSDHG